jgi:hypothetical protein|tara:strand:+ start:1081 stop:1491 length:411 start_codon:yes stop_codon:yes gene_type:complete
MRKTDTMEVNDIILNLKLISKIKQNEKMSVVDKVLKVDTRFIQPIFRWYTSDNRTDTITFIERVINTALIAADEEDAIQKDFPSVLHGLDNLSATYKLDNLIVSKIDILKDKIVRQCKVTVLMTHTTNPIITRTNE